MQLDANAIEVSANRPRFAEQRLRVEHEFTVTNAA